MVLAYLIINLAIAGEFSLLRLIRSMSKRFPFTASYGDSVVGCPITIHWDDMLCTKGTLHNLVRDVCAVR